MKGKEEGELAKLSSVTVAQGDSFVKPGLFQKGLTGSKEQRQPTVNSSIQSRQADGAGEYLREPRASCIVVSHILEGMEEWGISEALAG